MKSAIDSINNRRIIIYCREQIEQLLDLFKYEPNDSLTLQSFAQYVRELLEDLERKEIIYQYESNVKEDYSININIQPKYGSEKININFKIGEENSAEFAKAIEIILKSEPVIILKASMK